MARYIMVFLVDDIKKVEVFKADCNLSAKVKRDKKYSKHKIEEISVRLMEEIKGLDE